MTWAKLDDCFPDHPKIVEAGPLGMAVHVAGICYCARYLTDGHITRKAARRLIDLDELGDITQVIDTLVAVGLWITTADGYLINDFLEYNPSRADVEAQREKRTAAAKKAANTRWGCEPQCESHANRIPDRIDMFMHPSRPVPSPSSSSDTYPQEPAAVADEERIEQVINRLVDHRVNRNGKVRNPAAYKLKVKASLKTDGIVDQATQLVTNYPTAPIDVIADAIEGDGRNLTHYRDATDRTS